MSYEVFFQNKHKQARANYNRELIEIGNRVQVVCADAGAVGYKNGDEGVVWRLLRDEHGTIASVQVEWLDKGGVGYKMVTLWLWEFEIVQPGFFAKILDRLLASRVTRAMKEFV